jgi:glycosyltransferase involved in cell wall biosynthesis
MKSKTLIIISPGFPKDESDTTCLPSQQLLVSTIQKLFPDIKLIVVSLQYPYHSEKYLWNDIQIVPLNGKLYKDLLRLLLWLRAYRVLSAISKEVNVIGVLSFWCNETALIGNIFTRRKNLNHKIWICGQDARKENRFVKWIKPSPTQLVAMSDFLQSEFKKNHAIAPTTVIYNGVQTTFENLPKDIDVIGAGSLIPLKQYDIFLEVIAEIKKHRPEIRAVLVGKGPEEEKLRNQIVKLGLEINVELKGELNHTELMHWMNRSKILIHPSFYEGYSTVCLEGLANGCHVVSFTHAESSSVKHWHIVKDINEMTDVTKHLLETEEDFQPVLLRNIEASARQMISPFTKSGSHN